MQALQFSHVIFAVSLFAGNPVSEGHAAEANQSLPGTAGVVDLPLDKLLAGDAEPDDNFGYALSISGTTAVVGAWQNNAPSNNSGAAYVFERDLDSDMWHQVIKLVPDADNTGDQFGRAVAIDGQYIVVGAQWDDDAGNDRGAAYVFRRTPEGATPWSRDAKLTADDGAFRDFFGQTVAIAGTRVAVGAPEDTTDENGSDSGSVYVFERNAGTGAWIQVDKLIADDGQPNDIFASALALDGNWLIAGAPEHNPDGINNAGAAYVFQRSGATGAWSQVDKLIADDADASDEFGYAVALAGATAVVGAPFDDDSGNAGGSAYVFQRNTGTQQWNQTDKLMANDASLGNRFGNSVAAASGRVLVGAHWEDEAGDDSGSAYLFEMPSGSSNYIQLDKFTANDAADEDWFGYAVAMTEEYALVGAHQDDDQESEESGSAYLFRHNDLIFQDEFEQ